MNSRQYHRTATPASRHARAARTQLHPTPRFCATRGRPVPANGHSGTDCASYRPVVPQVLLDSYPHDRGGHYSKVDGSVLACDKAIMQDCLFSNHRMLCTFAAVEPVRGERLYSSAGKWHCGRSGGSARRWNSLIGGPPPPLRTPLLQELPNSQPGGFLTGTTGFAVFLGDRLPAASRHRQGRYHWMNCGATQS